MSNNSSGAEASVPPAAVLPLRMKSVVVRGFGRGSADLGIPTANLDPSQLEIKSKTRINQELSLQSLPTGIYWGFCRIGSSIVFPAAISMGYNPTYGNEAKTIEPHLIAPPGDPSRHASSCGETLLRDFYGESCRLSIVEYIRPELPFEGLEKLVEAIKNDIAKTEQLCATPDQVAIEERVWVESESPL